LLSLWSSLLLSLCRRGCGWRCCCCCCYCGRGCRGGCVRRRWWLLLVVGLLNKYKFITDGDSSKNKLCACAHTYLYTCIYVCIYICISVYNYICICMYINMYTQTYIYIYIYICIYIYTCTYIYTHLYCPDELYTSVLLAGNCMLCAAPKPPHGLVVAVTANEVPSHAQRTRQGLCQRRVIGAWLWQRRRGRQRQYQTWRR
jgi:hypothetical protein